MTTVEAAAAATAAKTDTAARSGATLRSGGLRGRRLAGRAVQALLRSVLALVLAAASALFLFLGIGPRLLGYETSTMLTGSMAPVINPGDVVVSVRTPTSALKAGDIITYRIPVQDQRVETHRVASVSRTPAGATVITTKGDANSGPDPWTAVITDSSVYTTVAVVPHLGDVVRALRSTAVRSMLLFGAPAVLVAMLLASIWKRPRGDGGATARKSVQNPVGRETGGGDAGGR